MSFPRYEQYKDSEHDWLGQVPDHWKIGKFRHHFTESSEKIDGVGTVDSVMLSVSGYRGIEVKEYEDENQRRSDDDLIGYRIVRPGQLVVNTMWLNYAGLGVSELSGHVSPAYRSYWIDEQFEKRFVHHLMRSEQYVVGYTKFLTGVRPNSLQMSRDDLMIFPALIPPPAEQRKIAAFLDQETAKIDALIKEQQRLIELLKEKRQAVISHAVTKGLNPQTECMDTGIDWIGQIPSHWKIGKCGFYISILSGFAFPSEKFSNNECDVKLLRGINVGVGVIRWDEAVYWCRTTNDGLNRYEMRTGDIVLGMDRPIIGSGVRVAMVRDSDLPCLLLQRVARITAQRGLLAEYLLALLSSEMFFAHFSPETTGVSVPHISPEQISNFTIPIPPIEEQRKIVTFLAAESDASYRLIASSEHVISLLQERRSALISFAVTGKIDVRNYTPKEAA
jgi:type I restriction enzyme, S subunit